MTTHLLELCQYLILRGVVPRAMLDPLRRSADAVLHVRWPEGIQPEQFQPMIHGLENLVDSETANLAEFLFHANTLGVSSRLMRDSEAALSAAFMMNEPVADHGPWWWHRNVNPGGTKGPLGGLQQDILANGACVVHWNIALCVATPPAAAQLSRTD